jgi:hypothetical protein
VIADAVAFVYDALEQFGILSGIVAYHEECGLDVVSFQHIEYEWRGFGYGTVIKGQID